MSGANILIADDHPLFRDALRLAVSRAAPDARITETGALAETVAALHAADPPDLVLLDLKLCDCEGFAGLALLHAERPQTPVLVISGADPARVAPAVLALGAVGFLPKSASLAEISEGISRALAKQPFPSKGAPLQPPPADDAARRLATLTPAQLRVLFGILKGRLNKQIAHDMNISEATVKAHVTAIMRKLDVQSRTQAALAARSIAEDPQQLS